MRIFLMTLAFLCWHGAAVAADYSHALEHGDTARSFEVHVPDKVAGRENLPVVIMMHGGGGNAKNARDQTGLDAVADRRGFIAVYPDGNTGRLGKFRTWNAGRCCGIAARQKADDVGFISAMIDFLIKQYRIDASRVYATGHSNGAQMSYRLACELSERIAAIAPNAGQRVLDDCNPPRSVPVLHIHGTKDPCALFEGGEKCGGCFAELLGGAFSAPGDQWPCQPVREIVREHALMNGCADVTDIIYHKGAVTCERFQCPQNASVGLCSIEGAGHVWAGDHDRGPAACKKDPDRRICKRYVEIVGPAYKDMDAGELAWDFFRHYSLKGVIE